MPQPAENIVTVLAGLKQIAPNCAFREVCFGNNPKTMQAADVDRAVAAAHMSDLAVLVVGENGLRYDRSAKTCGENIDRWDLGLYGLQQELVERVAATGTPTVVVLINGRPLALPWIKAHIPAVVEAWEPGCMGGQAVAEVLAGKVNPSGKLPMSFPKHVGQQMVNYNRKLSSLWAGYVEGDNQPLWEFGYGLSYTSFAYSGLTLSRKVLAPGKAIEVLFTVENTGAMAGVETAQVYVAHRNSAAHQPVRTLAGFARVALKPGERKTVCVTLPPSALEFYDVARHAFVVEAGRYEVSVGRHSRCLLLHAAFTARGETVALPPAHSAGGPYGSFADNTFPDAAFAAIHTRPLPRNQKPVRGEYTQTTVLGDMLDSRTGRALHALALCAARLGMHFSNNPAVNRRVCEMTVRDLPFKNLVLNTSGIIRYPAAEALLALANGRLFSRGGTVRAER
ncbi:MAG: hypothetical protein EGP70_02710, partial [Butyricicoccus sp.]|nr:hypothetical protein [Butyricicoccus sp.]